MNSKPQLKSAHTSISVPLVFNDPSLITGFRAEDLKIDYEPCHNFSKQPLYADRVLLAPIIDLDLYRFRAVVDWIEFSLSLSASCANQSPVNIRSKILSCPSAETAGTSIFVSDPFRKTTGFGRHFIVKLQDPDPFALASLFHEIQSTFQLLSDRGGPFRIVGIEISLDAYVKIYDLMEERSANYHRWRMVDLMRRHTRFDRAFLEDARNRPRVYPVLYSDGSRRTKHLWGGGIAKPKYRRSACDDLTAKMLDAKNYMGIETDATYYIGAKDSPVFFRSMDKVTDRRSDDDNCREVLSTSESRARLEVTVQIPGHLVEQAEGLEHIDMDTPNKLFGYSFEKWKQAFFTFHLPTLSTRNGCIDPDEMTVFGRSGLAGLEHYQGLWREVAAERRPKRGVSLPIGSKDFLIRYTEMNEKVRRALRTLSESWRPR